MCSIETKCRRENIKMVETNKPIVNLRNERRCTTLSDNITFRHRHRRYSNDDTSSFESMKRPKLKSSNLRPPVLSSNAASPRNQINSNRLASRKNIQLVILGISFLVSILINSASAFNVDVNSKVVHSAPRSTCDGECMFGFSVAQHKEKGQSWLLVGAPAADSRQPGVYRGGAVYKCRPDSPNNCEIIPFDQEGNTLAPTGQQYDNKTGQWFGSLVRSSGEDGVVLACAPRYLWFSRNFKRREPVGSCYTAQNEFKDIQTHSPCRTRKWGYHRQGSCQAGLGAAIADNGNQMFIGAVGSWYWQGQVFSQNLLPRLRNVQHKTAEGSPSDDDSYLGYSVVTGEFDGDSSSPDVAVGMPRGSGLEGKVVLYNSNLTNLNNITGDQIGAYFGYSLASGDLDGDGRDDVIIGAPMWTNYEIMGKYETGRVYVVYQGDQSQFKEYVTLDGMNHKARFGLSVACAGNLNLDGLTAGNKRGVEDLIVGAPYDGPDHKGAIYVYLGSSERKASGQWKYAQVIYGKDVDTRLQTFGWSLSGGMDLDGNEYPDVLVGAYESANAVYMRSAPVVHLTSKVEFRLQGKQIDLETKNCRLRNGERVPCVDIDVSMSYDGIGVPSSIDLELQFILDAKKAKGRRLYFKDQEGISAQPRQVTVRKGKDGWKYSFKAYLYHPPQTSTIHDKLTSIDVEVQYKLATGAGRGRDLPPVLGQAELKARDSMSIQKNCGDDQRCVPDLSVDFKPLSGNYVIGSKEKIVIKAIVANGGEDAFNARFFLQIPRGVSFSKANSSDTEVSLLCDEPTAMNEYTLRCEIGNPLAANSMVEVMVYLQPDEKNQDAFLEGYEFRMAANSSNPEANSMNQKNNEMTFTVPLEVVSDIRITGKSEPSMVQYNSTAGYAEKYLVEDQIGDPVTHIYDLKNKGPSIIQEADVYILWPSFTGDGYPDNKEDLLYLLGVEYDDKKVTCQTIDNINPRYVKTSGSPGYAEAYALAEQEYLKMHSSGQTTSWIDEEKRWVHEEFDSHSGGSGSFNSISSSSSSGQQGSGGRYEYESGNSESSSASNVNNVFGAAKGPGDYHGTMSKDELEKEAGGTIFTSDNEETRDQVEKTRYQGATETRLTEDDRLQSSSSAGEGGGSNGDNLAGGSSGYQSSYEYEKSMSSGSSSSSQGGSAGSAYGSSSRGNIAQSEWKLLDNGTYIKVYHSKSTAGGGGRGSNAHGGRGGGHNSGSSDSGWVVQPDGSRRRQQSSWSSSSNTKYETDSSVTSSAGNNNVNYGQSSRGTSAVSPSATETRLSSSSTGNSNTNTILNAAVGPGDYHGTMRKEELEREAGGTIFGSTNTETRNQVDNTRYQGSGYSNGNTYQGSNGGGSTSYRQGSYYDDRETYDNGGKSRTGQSSSSSSQDSTVGGGQNLFGGGYSKTSSSSSSSSSISSSRSSPPKGQWVWDQLADGGKGKWEWSTTTSVEENQSSVTKTSGTQSGGGYSSSDGSYTSFSSSGNDRGYVIQPNGTIAWGSSSGYGNGRGNRYGDESSYGGVRLNSEDAEEISRHFAHGEILDHNRAQSNGMKGDETGDIGRDTTGWIKMPDGTLVRKSSSWASWSKTGHSEGDLDPEYIKRVQQELENKAKANLHNGGNYVSSRRKRSYVDVDEELESCVKGECTLIQCKVGPMRKDEVLTFKIRSRLFEETQIKKFQKRVDISSKMITRITRLPYQANPSSVDPQVGRVTTEVFPSDMGEGTIPWWVWLLAALGGLLLLALITYSLYKCGFFKRKRPDDSPEREPLNGNGYH